MMESVRILEIPPCKMVSSGRGMFGDGILEHFNEWFSALPRPIAPRDFLWADEESGKLVWYYIYEDSLDIPDEFELVDFPGGLYAVVTGIDGRESGEEMAAIRRFLLEHPCFEEDFSRVYLGNIPTPPLAAITMGYSQMDYYIPIRLSGNRG